MFQKVDEKAFRKYSFFTALILLVVTLAFASQYSKLRIDYDFEKFFPINDQETDFFRSFRERFETDNDFVFIAVENEKGVFQKDFLENLKKMQVELDSMDRIEFTSSLVSENENLVYGGGFVVQRPYINFDKLDLKRDESLLYKNPETANLFVSKDRKATLLILRHEDYLAGPAMDEFVKDLHSIVDHYSFDDIHVAGRVVGQMYYITKMSRELLLFVSLSLLLVMIFLLIAFKSGWGLILPLIVILLAMSWVIGFMGLYNEPVSVVMTTLPSIMFVVAMSDVIHLISRYLDAFRTGIGKFESIKLAVREVGMATFLTSVTTAIGFFTLQFVSVQPLQVFGIVTGFGVLIAFVLTFVLLPILFYYFPSPRFILKGEKDYFWKKKLSSWFVWMIRSKKTILTASALVVGVSIYFTTQIEVNNYLMDELKPTEPIKQDFNFLDQNFGGVRPLEVVFTLKNEGELWQKDRLLEMQKVSDYLTDSLGVEVRSSLPLAISVANRTLHSGDSSFCKIPSKKSDLRKIRRGLKGAQKGEIYQLMVDSTETIVRMNGIMPDIGSKKYRAFQSDFYEFVEQNIDSTIWSVQLTGTAHLFDKNIAYLSVSMIKGLSVSILIVALIMGLVYRSFRMVVLSIIPNLLPLICISGIMGIFGIELKTSIAIIFTIAFGIAVDDTIHFLGKFKYELLKGRSKMYALKRSFITTGKAMILTTLILCAGFLLLMMSSFQGTFLMGVLLCFTLLVALVADLTLLPILLMLFYKVPKSKKGVS